MTRKTMENATTLKASDSPDEGRPGDEAPPVEESVKKQHPIWYELFSLPEDAQDDAVRDIVNRDVADTFANEKLASDYNIRVLFDPRSIDSGDADKIYRSLENVDRSKPLLLVIKSPGGSISAAFFVAKVCREHTTDRFAVAVPREAKSAATLICCGADAIHMGSLSELGPIDPQFGSTPALALKHSVEHLAEMAGKYPAATTLLSEYLVRSLRIEALGYYERVAASAAQYAVRLLRSRISVSQTAEEVEAISQQLVYAYKDHGFVIDSREATDIFGATVVECNTREYDMANRLYSQLDLLEFLVRRTVKRRIAFTGDIQSGCTVFRD